MINVGIDLGTTYSSISHVNSHGVPALFPDRFDANEFRTPSVVHIGQDSCLVGQTVEDLLEDEPLLPIVRFVKLKTGTQDSIYTDSRGRDWSPTAVSALILRKLLQDVSAYANEDVEGALVTVPAQFGDAQRRAAKEAALLAGIPLPVLMEEPVAAATFHGLHESTREQTLFIYDLGGGTFDATILHASPDGLRVLATEGAVDVGGKAFDEAIMDEIGTDYHRTHGTLPLDDAATALELRRLAEQVKVKIGKPSVGQVRKTMLLCGKTYDFALTRSQYEGLITPLVDKTMDACDRCLKGAALAWAAIDKVVLAGGSVLTPLVQNRIRIASDKPGDKVIVQQPHQAVAYGAALLAQQASGKTDDDLPRVTQRICAYDLGIRVWDKRQGRPAVKPLIKRNTPLPGSASTTLYTSRSDQRRMIIEMVQSRGEEDKSLGYFEFGSIAKPRKNYPVELTVAYDIEGLVRVSARDPLTGAEMDHTMQDEHQAETASLLRQRELLESVRVNE